MSTEEIVPSPGVPAPVDVPTIPTPALPLDLMPIAPWITADHLQEPLEAPVSAGETLDARRARIQLGRRLGALSGRDWVHVGVVALLAGLLVFGAGLYAVRQGRHIQAANNQLHRETDRANGLDVDLGKTKDTLAGVQSDLSGTRSALNSTQIDRDVYKGKVSAAEATAAAAAGKVSAAQAQRDAVTAHEEARRLACSSALEILNQHWYDYSVAVVRSAPLPAIPDSYTTALNKCLNKSAAAV